jgi:hypothetical protein
MASQPRLGRPRKYGRPSRAVTVTLPDDILARLADIHADVGSAIVNLVERKTTARVKPLRVAELTRYGKHAVILVTPIATLRKLKGVHLVPVGDGRALISLAPTTSIPSLELQVRDALESRQHQDRDREALERLADILRRGRAAGELTSEARTIIVLARRTKRQSN